MKKIVLALLMLFGLLVPVQLMTAPSASAATCGDMRQKSATARVGQTSSTAGVWDATITVNFRTCVRNDGQTVARVYYFGVLNDAQSCGFLNEGIRVNPNVIGDWNPGPEDRTWPANNCDKYFWFNWNAPGDWTTVFASAPANERCLGGSWTAYLDSSPDDTDPLNSVCVI